MHLVLRFAAAWPVWLAALSAFAGAEIPPASAAPPDNAAVVAPSVAPSSQKEIAVRDEVRQRAGRAGEAIERLLERAKIPAASIAVIADFDIEWASAYGVCKAGSEKAADTETLFQAASISKPVAALAALRLVEEGKLELDEDVNRRLSSWKLPANGFTDQRKVTLRHLLSHNGGLTVHGFPGYASDAPVATLLQVLDGQIPANTAAIRVDMLPGTKWRYSGGGYCIVQQMVIDAGGKPFAESMRHLVLEPAGMTRSTYEQPLPGALAENAATAHRVDGSPIAGGWHIYPEMAAAGLWTTPTDLARFFIALHRASTGDDGALLSQSLAGEMLSPQLASDWGLGLSLGGQGEAAYFGHGGSNAGFKCIARLYRNSGHGAVVMINHDNGAILNRVMNILRDVQEWPQ